MKLLAYASILSLILLFTAFAHASLYDMVPVNGMPNLATASTYGSRLEVWSPDVHSSNITSTSLFPPGSQFAVRVNITSPGPISGFDVTLNYNITSSNPNILHAVKTGAELSGGLFDPSSTPAGCFVILARNQIDLPPGRIRLAAVMAGGCSAQGSGTLFTILFRVSGYGTGFIDFVRTGSQGQTITKVADGPPNFQALVLNQVDGRFQNVPGIPPIPVMSHSPDFPVRGDNISFAGGRSYDPDNSGPNSNGISKYLWIFGDGSGPVQGPNQIHEFFVPSFVPASGNFTAMLMVWDSDSNLANRVNEVIDISPGMGHQASNNWSGYAVSGSPGSVTDVKGSWIVPGIIGDCGPVEQHASFWVGIDGLTSASVEQIGTDSGCMNGVPVYFAWYEFYPQPAHLISSVKIRPGDIIYAEVSYSPGIPGSGNGDHNNGSNQHGNHDAQNEHSDADGSAPGFTLTLIDLTSGKSFIKHGTVTAPLLSSAEWVAEAPSDVNGTLPLANFGKVRFGQNQTGSAGTNYTTVSGITGPVGSFGTKVVQLIMVVRGGFSVKAAPSELSPDSTSFIVHWFEPGP